MTITTPSASLTKSVPLANFKPLLSAKIDTDEDWFRLRKPQYMVSPKLDGIRILLHPTKGPVTRTLKSIPNKHIRECLIKYMEAFPEIVGFDGEIIIGTPEISSATAPDAFNRTSSAVMSHEGTPRVTFWIFDQFYSGAPSNHDHAGQYYKDRYHKLKHTLSVIDHTDTHPNDQVYRTAIFDHRGVYLKLVGQTVCNHISEIAKYEEQYQRMGFEGIMIRDPLGKYKFGRATLVGQELIKIKRFCDAEAYIVGFEELQRNYNAAEEDAFGNVKRSSQQANLVGGNTLGTLRVEVANGPFKGTFVGVSGFSDALKQEIWDNKEKYLNQLITFKYQESGSKGVPRFPIFKNFRNLADIEDL